MDPVEALDEISFWLERSLAPTFKVQAFRKAADVVRQLPPGELPRLIASGRLTSLKGLATAARKSFRRPWKTAFRTTWPTSASGAANRSPPVAMGLLRPCAATCTATATGPTADRRSKRWWRQPALLGREYLALTDHSPNLTIANGLSAERLEQQLGIVEEVNAGQDGFRLLQGIEVDILEDGTLDQTPEMLERLNVVVASVHSKLRSDSKTMTQRMLGGISDPHTNVLGHCTGRLVQGSRGTRPESEFDAAKVFKECAEWGVAVEINSRPERQDPPERLIQMALDAGCFFSIDSDAHAPGQLDFLQYGAERAEAAGVPRERIVTTWPLAQLQEWLALKK